jgi:all-trans-retinol 13,14-reductase
MEKKYPLIVIGAGIAGLSTALAWKKVFPGNQKDVLIVERNAVVGGCVTTFARNGFIFDTTQIIPDISDVLQFFEVDLKLKKFEEYYARVFMANTEDGTVKIAHIPSSPELFRDYLITHYPEDQKAINKFFNCCLSMHQELGYLKTEPRWYQLPGILFRCPGIILSSSKTYREFLSGFVFRNAEVVRILDTFSAFSGLSGDRCSALLTACAMVTTLKGSFRPEKGFISFPILLKKKLQEQGVEIRTKTEADSILTREGKVVGVKLKSGEIIRSDYVVSTADTKVTFRNLLGMKVLKSLNRSYYKKVHQARMSPSGFTIYLGLDDKIDLKALGFNCGYNVLSSGPDAFATLFKAWERKELMMSDECFHLAAICPSIMTGGKPTLIIRVVPVHADYWIQLRKNDYQQYLQEKFDVARFYVHKAEQYMIPGLTNHIIYTDVSTPATYERFLGSPTGSQYDMMPVPNNFGKNRLPTRTPVKGLFVPKFSHGIWPAMQAGLQVVDMITNGRIMNGNSSYKKQPA